MLFQLLLGNGASSDFPTGFTSIHLSGSSAAAGHLRSGARCATITALMTPSSVSFLPDPDMAAANLKQCLAEIGFWKKASWLLLNLDKAEMILISRGKCFEGLVKFVTAPSAEGIRLANILRVVQCKHQVRIQLFPKLQGNSLIFLLDACFILKYLISFPLS